MNDTILKPSNPPAVSRRDFLKNSSLLTAGAVAAAHLPSIITSHAAPDDPIKVALIGCGGRGKGAAKDVLDAGKHLNAANPNVQIVALADVFEDQVTTARKDMQNLGQNVPAENCFSGLDAYTKALAVPGVNYAILAAPPGFRHIHFKAAVAAGKHVFMEKPVAVDGPTCRAMFEAGEQAEAKKLCVVAGTQRRHQAGYTETIKRLHDGAIGDILYGRVYWNTGAIWHRGEQGANEMEQMIRNWYHYVWLSGDHIVEQHVHQIDVANWVLKGHPVRAAGMGGRQALGNKSGHIWDHFAVEFEYEGGARVFSFCRQISGCEGAVIEHFYGTKGYSNPSGAIRPKEGGPWRYRGTPFSPYVQEHVDLITAIRTGQHVNETKTVTESTLTAVMGREAAYSGQPIEWDEILNSKLAYAPDKIEWGPAGKKYEPAMPGKHKLV